MLRERILYLYIPEHCLPDRCQKRRVFNSEVISDTKGSKCLLQIRHVSQDRIELVATDCIWEQPSWRHSFDVSNQYHDQCHWAASFEGPKHQKEADKEIRQWVQMKFYIWHSILFVCVFMCVRVCVCYCFILMKPFWKNGHSCFLAFDIESFEVGLDGWEGSLINGGRPKVF